MRNTPCVDHRHCYYYHYHYHPYYFKGEEQSVLFRTGGQALQRQKVKTSEGICCHFGQSALTLGLCPWSHGSWAGPGEAPEQMGAPRWASFVPDQGHWRPSCPTESLCRDTLTLAACRTWLFPPSFLCPGDFRAGEIWGVRQ